MIHCHLGRPTQTYYTVLSFQQRGDLLNAVENDVDMTEGDDGEWVDEEDIALRRAPPGEEAFFQSHAGGEARLQELMLDMNG